MRRIFLVFLTILLLTLLLITACQVKEVKPGSFKIIKPADGATNVALQPTIEIEDSSDVPTTYDIYLDGKPAGINLSGTSLKVSEKLPPDTYHTIRVVRKVLGKLEEDSPDITFKTTRPPLKPWYAFPAKNYKFPIGSLLEWKTRDPDGDPVTFDVYIGESPDKLKKVAENIKTSSYKPEGLTPGKTYYWKVVVKDDKGASAESDVYSFKTYVPEFMKRYIYSTPYNGKISIIDITDISNPKFIKSIVDSKTIRGVAIYKNYLYADEDNEMKIFDLTTDKTTPKLINTVTTNDGKRYLFIFDNYLVRYENGGQVYDITDPENPEKLFSITMRGGGHLEWDIAYENGKLFVIASVWDPSPGNFYELKIFDIRTGNYLGGFSNSGGNWESGVEVSGNYLYTLRRKDKWNGVVSLVVYDISNINSPKEIKTITLEDKSYLKLYKNGDFLYAASDDYDGKIYKIDISDPANPKLAGSINNIKPGWIRNMSFIDSYAIASVDRGGIVIANTKDNSVISSYDVHGWPYCSDIGNNHLYVFDSDYKKLIIYDENLTEQKVIDGVEWIESMKSYGDRFYITGGGAEIDIVDISDPVNPSLVKKVTPSMEIKNLKIQGNYLYALGTSGLFIYDITDPDNPKLSGSVNLPVENLEVMGIGKNFAIVASRDWDKPGFFIVNISNKNNPKIVYQDLNSFVDSWVAAKDFYAFALISDKNWNRKLVSFDVSNPDSPKISFQMSVDNWKSGVAIYKNYLLTYRNGLEIYDISDPSNISLSGTFFGDKYPTDSAAYLTVSGTYLYLNVGWYGLIKIDLSDIKNPKVVKDEDWFVSNQTAVVGE